MAFPVNAVANTFLDLAGEIKIAIDPMKMQKLVYFAHGWHLGLANTPLINEPIEAWDFGPVVASLYRELRQYGAGPISERITDFAPNPSRSGFRLVAQRIQDDSEKNFLRRILTVYGARTALQLSEITHRPDTPWSRVRAERPGARGVIIPDDLMTQYFKNLAQQNAARHAAANI